MTDTTPPTRHAPAVDGAPGAPHAAAPPDHGPPHRPRLPDDHDHDEGLGSPEIFAFLGGFVVVAALALLIAWAAGLMPLGRRPARHPATVDAARVVDRPAVSYDVGTFTLIDQDGAPFGSDDLRGGWWVAGFVFSGCASICPPMMVAIRRVQDAIADLPPTVRLVCFSVDPDNDTPDVLHRWGTRFGANFARWTLLTGDREEIWDIARSRFRLGVGDDADNRDMPILHSRRLALVDPDGVVRAYFDGLETSEVEELIARLRHEANADARARR